MAATTPDGAADLGDHLRHWRGVRGRSQLDLASEAGTTPRYVSFVETGRSQPSRQMVLRLAPSTSRCASATTCSARLATRPSIRWSRCRARSSPPSIGS